MQADPHRGGTDMQTLLQNLTEYWPIMGALSPALRRELQQELVPMIPAMFSLAGGLMAAGAAMAVKAGGVAGIFSAFFLGLFPFMTRLENRRNDPGVANVEYGKFKVIWQGSLALGCLVAGLLLALLSIGLWMKA
jgi:hypothetical protein